MSSSRPHQVGEAVLTDLRPNPWSPPVTDDQMFAFCQKRDNDILCYAKRHNLHWESLLRMFTIPGPNIPLLELYIMSESLGDEAMPGILKGFCEIMAPVLDIKVYPHEVHEQCVKEQQQKFFAMVDEAEMNRANVYFTNLAKAGRRQGAGA